MFSKVDHHTHVAKTCTVIVDLAPRWDAPTDDLSETLAMMADLK